MPDEIRHRRLHPEVSQTLEHDAHVAPPQSEVRSIDVKPRHVWLALGSNIGQRETHLQHVVDELSLSPDFSDVKVSRVWSTAAVGGPRQPDYLNAVVQVRTSLSAQDLLKFAHRCEGQRGRIREQRWGPRTLDVDIVAIEGETYESVSLIVPHPRAHERAFVVLPLSDLVNPRSLLGPTVVDTSTGVALTDIHLHVPADDAPALVTRRQTPSSPPRTKHIRADMRIPFRHEVRAHTRVECEPDHGCETGSDKPGARASDSTAHEGDHL